MVRLAPSLVKEKTVWNDITITTIFITTIIIIVSIAVGAREQPLLQALCLYDATMMIIIMFNNDILFSYYNTDPVIENGRGVSVSLSSVLIACIDIIRIDWKHNIQV